MLVLHPRNNHDSLLVCLDTDGQQLRQHLLEMKSWMELYSYCLEEKMLSKDSLVPFYTLVDSSIKSPEYHINIQLLDHAIPTDGFFLKNAVIRVNYLMTIQLVNVQFSQDGAVRLAELIDRCQCVSILHLESNYFDEVGTDLVIDAVAASTIPRTASVLKFIKNKLSESNTSALLEAITREKSKSTGVPLKCLSLTYAGIADSTLLILETLLENYFYTDNPFALDLSGNSISVNGLVLLGEMISKFQLISDLGLQDLLQRDTGRNGLRSILEHLVLSECVKTLDFRSNFIVGRSYKSAISFLTNNKWIERLTLPFDGEVVSEFHFSNFAQMLGVFRFTLVDHDTLGLNQKAHLLKIKEAKDAEARNKKRVANRSALY